MIKIIFNASVVYKSRTINAATFEIQLKQFYIFQLSQKNPEQDFIRLEKTFTFKEFDFLRF